MSLTKLQLQKLRSTPWWGQIKREELSPTKPFEEARDLARIQGFNNGKEYKRWSKNIAGMPATPEKVYKDKGWTDWGDFIGTGRKLRSPAEHVQTAERLAQEHGVLAKKSWLCDHFRGLYDCMLKYPELFSHIPQAKKTKINTPSEHVQTAERLVKEHGVLPSYIWLRKNGFSGLLTCMHHHPELFSHIQQESLFTSPAEHVQTAERLAKEHGILPKGEWLRKNGFRALAGAVAKRPDLFSHIPQTQKPQRTSPSEHVQTAERLATEHGVLPNQKWLVDHGFSGLYSCMWRRPDLFVHIPRQKWERSPSEHVQTAERLVTEYGGLPNQTWLGNNGHDALYQYMRRHPELFAHIPRQESKFKTHADCHPDRKHQAHSLCSKCYQRKQYERKQKRVLVAPERPPVFERNELVEA